MVQELTLLGKLLFTSQLECLMFPKLILLQLRPYRFEFGVDSLGYRAVTIIYAKLPKKFHEIDTNKGDGRIPNPSPHSGNWVTIHLF